MFREFFYIHKSDRRVILALLAVGAVVLVVMSLMGEDGRGTKAFQS